MNHKERRAVERRVGNHFARQERYIEDMKERYGMIEHTLEGEKLLKRINQKMMILDFEKEGYDKMMEKEEVKIEE